MVTNTKLPEIRKDAFVKAREELGLSTKDLSAMSCLSVRQIEQIESGETSSFYGAQVKFTAAKKVAALLNLSPKDAFEFSGDTQLLEPADEQPKLEEKVGAPAVQKTTTLESPKEIKSNKVGISNRNVKSKAQAEPKKKKPVTLKEGEWVLVRCVRERSGSAFHTPCTVELFSAHTSPGCM